MRCREGGHGGQCAAMRLKFRTTNFPKNGFPIGLRTRTIKTQSDLSHLSLLRFTSF